MLKKYVIIVAGGTGSRMNSELPKQFLMLGEKPIIIHTIERFLNYDAKMECIVVVHELYQDYLKNLLKEYNLQNCKIGVGGITRFHSVKNGLACVTEKQSIVGVHDAARPLVNLETLKACYELAEEKGNAIPTLPIHESIRHITTTSNKAVNRKEYQLIQTPQCFKYDIMVRAYEQTYTELFTDDASVVEAAGHVIHLTKGNLENIKITHPHDLQIASFFLAQNVR
jgi:2-C-methyl-D-erythritol 4-phosphate cytidylyltransferase